jgi:farnesyl diphosphate synthase
MDAASEDFGGQLEVWRVRMEGALAARLPEPDLVPARLHEAMRYSVLGGGKRIRPALVFATARAVGLTEDDVEAAACAIELVHVYSLVHDDLPAMDDDDMRRGRPTCHKAYDPKLPASPAIRLKLIDTLAEAIGTFGMAGGQAIDLAAQGTWLDIGQVEDMHARKTGAVIRASVLMAAECAPPLDPKLYAALSRFASAVGLAFQIQDDLLDVTGDASMLGKATGADSERAKPTHPAIIGIQASQQRVRLLHTQAINALAPFGARADSLRSLANWLLTRQY